MHSIYICIYICIYSPRDLLKRKQDAVCVYMYILVKRPHKDTGWRRLIESPKLQIIFHKRATKYRSLSRKITQKHKGSYEFSPPCNTTFHQCICIQGGNFHKRATKCRSLLWKMTQKRKGSYEFSPSCIVQMQYMNTGRQRSIGCLISGRSFFAKEPLIIGLFWGK